MSLADDYVNWADRYADRLLFEANNLIRPSVTIPRRDPRDLFPSTHWDNTPDPHFASRHRITSRDLVYVMEEVGSNGRRRPWWNIAWWMSKMWALVLGVRH